MVDRVHMRLWLTPSTTALALTSAPEFIVRSARPTDMGALASLMFAAYQHTIDFDKDSTPQDADEEVTQLINGAYGPFQAEVSRVIWVGGHAVSAALITRYGPDHAPLLAFSMTRPDWKRRGLARLALQSSSVALARGGAPYIDLVVTTGNMPAEAMYRQLGFVLL